MVIDSQLDMFVAGRFASECSFVVDNVQATCGQEKVMVDNH
jgi:hypothetical protein